MTDNLFTRLRRQAGRDVAVTMITNLLLGAAGFITAPLLGRGLRAAGRGELSKIQSVPALVAGFGLLGLNEAVVYWGIRDPGRRRASLIGSLRAAAVAATLLSIGTFAFLASRGASGAQLRYVAFILLTPLLHIPYETLRAAGDFRRWNLLKAMPSLMWLVAALAVGGGLLHTPSQVADAYLIGLAAIVPIFLVTAFRAAPDPSAPTEQDLRRLLRFGSTVMLTGAPQAVNLRLDLAVVAQTFSSNKAGIYAAAAGWAALAGPSFATLTSLALPRVTARGRAEVPRVVGATVAVFALTVLGAYPVTRILFSRVFGDDFRPGTNLAYLAVVAMSIWGTNTVLAATLRGLGSLRLPLFGEMVGLIATLGLLWPALHRYGLPGGQLTSVVSYGATTVVLSVGLWRALRRPPRLEPDELTEATAHD